MALMISVVSGITLQVSCSVAVQSLLQDVQCRVVSIHALRIKVTLHKLTGLFFYPSLYLIPENTQKMNYGYQKNLYSHNLKIVTKEPKE